ncbi:hypothetical protein [Cerasicoccus maritimus]|uniref:hypothetical protein n=1 Tax=Cerasicoccus maritimus TaxID=490089 RepID=UPI002852829D|nr:hypothetical protein [Cerasicoccus maritimus]
MEPKEQIIARLTAFYRKRGSALIAAFLFSMFVFIVLSSLMPMVVNDYESSVQNRLYNVAYAAAEAGADEVMWSLNNNRFDETGWYQDGWKVGDDYYGDEYWVREIRLPEDAEQSTDDIYAGEQQAVIRVVVSKPDENASSHQYAVYSKAVVTDTRTSHSAEKVISFIAELSPPFRGIVVKNELNYNSLMDSYDSSVGTYGVPATNMERENATAATVSESEDIKVVFGPQTDIRGQVRSGVEDAVNIDASKAIQITGGIQDGFNAEFPVITVPDTSDITIWRSSF